MRIRWLLAGAWLTACGFGGIVAAWAGEVELKSAGALAFSPEGVLFVADPEDASVLALEVNDDAGPAPFPPAVPNLPTDRF